MDLKEKIFNVAKDLQLSNCATITEEGKPWVRYVMGKADQELTFRFCTHIASRKVSQLKKNPNIHISLGVTDVSRATQWVQIQGAAEIVTDKAERHTFWYDMLKNIFTGPDDPNYVVVIVRPSRIELGTMGSMTPEVWEPSQ